MIIYPAMDMIEGSCVRLTKGRFDQMTNYKVSPVDQAKNFADLGATHLHIVDLDGAKDPSKRQTSLIQEIMQKTSLKTQVGGGIRSSSDVELLLGAGIDRVIVGSMAVKSPDKTKQMFKNFGGERIVLAFDVKVTDKAYVAHGAWEEVSTLSLENLVREYQSVGLKSVLCTDIDRDGTLTSPNFALYKKLTTDFPDIEFIASGGVSSMDDLRKLKAQGMPSVVLGKALYEGRVDLREALTC